MPVVVSSTFNLLDTQKYEIPHFGMLIHVKPIIMNPYAAWHTNRLSKNRDATSHKNQGKSIIFAVETEMTAGRSVAVAKRQRRKVRAAQSTPLPNRKASVKAE